MNVLSRPAPSADYRIAYGSQASQFGDLWIPQARNGTLFPLVVFYHGGWWKSEYDLDYAGHLCAALKGMGIATWSVEYRRVGETGGGWPTTFQDAAAGLDFAVQLAHTYPIDLTRVIAMGHSAGGHLAFWVAGRHRIDCGSELHSLKPKVALTGAIALAGAVDLRLTIDLSGEGIFAHDRREVHALMGGTPAELPDRYKAGNPGDLLPLNVPQILIQGAEDDQIPPSLPSRWIELAHNAGDTVGLTMVPFADHFDVVDPSSKAWKIVSDSIRSLIFPSR
jgi:acetyl esterase/lipase